MLHPFNLKLPQYYCCSFCAQGEIALWRKYGGLYKDTSCIACLNQKKIFVSRLWEQSKTFGWVPAIPYNKDGSWFGSPESPCYRSGDVDDDLRRFWLLLPTSSLANQNYFFKIIKNRDNEDWLRKSYQIKHYDAPLEFKIT